MPKISTNFRTLTPAYGRDYFERNAAKIAFLGGMDFKLQPEDQLCSFSDFTPGTKVILRYNKLRSTTTVTVP